MPPSIFLLMNSRYFISLIKLLFGLLVITFSLLVFDLEIEGSLCIEEEPDSVNFLLKMIELQVVFFFSRKAHCFILASKEIRSIKKIIIVVCKTCKRRFGSSSTCSFLTPGKKSDTRLSPFGSPQPIPGIQRLFSRQYMSKFKLERTCSVPITSPQI